MSLGDCSNHSTYCNSDPVASSINTAVGQGIIVIVSAGNGPTGNCESSGISNTDGPSSPACVENATAVGAVKDNDAIYYQRGALFELLAPGVDIMSTKYPNGGFQELDGTSMSAPHVAGAAALLKQFVKLQNGSNIAPQQIEDTLNNTGVDIDDSGGSGFHFSRINIYAAIIALDSKPPIIQFTNSSPANNSYTSSNSTIINITSNEILNSAWIQINNSNTTMNGSNTEWWVNISLSLGFSYNYIVFGNDSAGNLGNSETRIINTINSLPQAINVTTNCSDSLNRTNGTLTGSWDFSDTNQDSQTNNATKWYNNSIEVTSLRNLTNIASANTTKNQVWIFSVRVHDGTNWSNWTNSSNFTINNAAPDLSIVKNITIVNETGLVNITVNATDIDGDLFNYSINDSKFTQSNNNSFTWQTNLTDAGTYAVRINVTDGTDSNYRDFDITVLDAPDFDGDGNPDLNDTDDDNDGINDTLDKLKGNVSNINSTTTLKLFINGSENTTKIFNDTLEINITDSNNVSLVQFNWNFTNSTLVVNWTVDYSAANGTILIKNLDLTSQQLTKTVYINKSSSSYNYVCIADYTINSISDITSACTGANEIKLLCTGTSGQYSCTDLSTKFKVTGLNHSAVEGLYVSSDNGGGGGGGGGRTTTQTCTESWNCTPWQPTLCPITRRQTRNCTDLNNCSTPNPLESRFCFNYKPEIEEENITETIVDELTETEPVETKTPVQTQVADNKGKSKIIPTILIPLLLILLSILIFILIKRLYHKKKVHKAHHKPHHPQKHHTKEHHKIEHHHSKEHHETEHHKTEHHSPEEHHRTEHHKTEHHEHPKS